MRIIGLIIALSLAPAAAWAQCSSSNLSACPSPPFNAVTAATLAGNASASTATGNGVTNTLGTWTGYLSFLANPNDVQWVNSSPTVNLTYDATQPTNLLVIGSGGNVVSYCPTLSCVTTPTADHQRASALYWSTTAADGQAEEQTLAIETIVQTGFAKTWATSTTFNLGDNISFPAANTVYREVNTGPCTSASSGSGPTGTGTAIADGTCAWTWINDSAIDSKVGIYDEESVSGNAGNSWAQANNVTLQSGMTPSFNVNTELDYTNNAATCNLGVANCNGLEMNMAGNFQSTQGIHLSSTNSGSTFATIWGIRLNSAKLASSSDIEDDAAAPVGLGFNFGGLGSGSHSTATILDNTSSPVSLAIQGSHADESISDTSTSPAALNAAGTYSLTAISTEGATASNALLVANGQKICFNDTDACFSHVSGKLIYTIGGVNMFSIADTTGNAIFKGTVTPSGSP